MVSISSVTFAVDPHDASKSELLKIIAARSLNACLFLQIIFQPLFLFSSIFKYLKDNYSLYAYFLFFLPRTSIYTASWTHITDTRCQKTQNVKMQKIPSGRSTSTLQSHRWDFYGTFIGFFDYRHYFAFFTFFAFPDCSTSFPYSSRTFTTLFS